MNKEFGKVFKYNHVMLNSTKRTTEQSDVSEPGGAAPSGANEIQHRKGERLCDPASCFLSESVSLGNSVGKIDFVYKIIFGKSSSRRRNGFTLAEVLITLGIIGIVAAMTIPTLMNNKVKQETVSKLEKEYTVLSQAIKLSENDNGPNSTWDWGDGSGTLTPRTSFDTYWAPYLKILKYCNSYSDCGYKSNYIKFLSGTDSTSNIYDGTTRIPVILSDGSTLIIVSSPSKLIYFDINGGAGPNKYGKDVFRFILNSQKGIYPDGYWYVQSTTDCKSGGNGLYCAAKIIILDSWQLKDDYPW